MPPQPKAPQAGPLAAGVPSAGDRGAGPLVLGIDPSLTGTGIMVVDAGGHIYHQELVSTKPGDFLLRAHTIIDAAEHAMWDYRPSLVAIEGLAMGARGMAMLDLAGLHWLLRYRLEGAIPVPPMTLKKWVAGTGNAKKDVMLLKTYKRWGVEFTDDNLCDAYCLARWGLAFLAGEVEVKVKTKKARKPKEAAA